MTHAFPLTGKAQKPDAGWTTPISVAPMLDLTDRHCRYFHRLLSANILLYTEMVTTQAIVHSKNDLLSFNPIEKPLALQLAGNDPKTLAACAQKAAALGYDEINFNVGCPSPKVQKGGFGAILMRDPDRVAACVHAMAAAVTIPISVKTRIGIDESDTEPFLCHFVEKLDKAGCQKLILHARKAWLSGLNPQQNRAVPPLNYERVYAIKRAFQHLHVVLNGGIATIEAAVEQLKYVDSVMIGRAAYYTPQLLLALEKGYFQKSAEIESSLVEMLLQQFFRYLILEHERGARLGSLLRPLLGWFHGAPDAKKWRRTLMDISQNSNHDTGELRRRLEHFLEQYCTSVPFKLSEVRKGVQ